ncbi:MAG: response regulator [Planctomycetota bacterium]|nr:MAG: response regulator [Planctomycetota bacterium]
MKDLKKILLAEDEEDIQIIAQMALEEIGGFKVCHCRNGLEALEQIETFQPQIVLLDVMMPKMDGLTAFEELKKRGLLAELPIVFMTAKVQNHEIHEYLEKGATGVIIKPFDPMELPNQVQELWKKWNQGNGAAS